MTKVVRKTKNLIQKNSERIIKEFVEKAEVLSGKGNAGISHTTTKGFLRESFVSDTLEFFLPNQFGIGSGIIVNHKGDQSKQTDIIIYDNRILPPFIKEQKVGVYPAESVIAVIEVKSILGSKEIKDAEKSAKYLLNKIYTKKGFSEDCQGYIQTIKPLCAIVGFFGQPFQKLSKSEASKESTTERENAEKWLNDNIKYLSAICHSGNYSWIKFKQEKYMGWKPEKRLYQETIRFIAVIIDNIRTASEKRIKKLTAQHQDWLSIYTRY
ncbi:MAG: hypothetical protein UT82_C0021G0010 [Parcubacteria group bacterium GW2011_GWB1_40_14]|nr:MAG: hypothetical protein UT82_C0021G0010 [Parcubacteria group bacterium GW2011_GWB1_40_14]